VPENKKACGRLPEENIFINSSRAVVLSKSAKVWGRYLR